MPMEAFALQGLSKMFRRGRGETWAIKDLTFDVPSGQIVGLLGPNGAGKSTTIKCILGLLLPTSGRVRLLGRETGHDPRRAAAGISAMLEGSRNIYWRLTVRENLEYFAALHGRDIRRDRPYHLELLSRLDLEDRQNQPVSQLSQGMKQKAALACCLARRTPIVFLDEPTLGLDVETSQEMKKILPDLLEGEGTTAVVCSHDLRVIEEACERVIILCDGHVIADDTLQGLLSVFRTRSYRLVTLLSPPAELLAELRASFLGVRVTPGEAETLLEVDLPAAQAIFHLMDILRRHEVVPETISRQEPDLERVYLSLVRQEGVASA